LRGKEGAVELPFASSTFLLPSFTAHLRSNMDQLPHPSILVANAPTVTFLQLAQACQFVDSRGEEIPWQGRWKLNEVLRIAHSCNVCPLSCSDLFPLGDKKGSRTYISPFAQRFVDISVLRSGSAFVSGLSRTLPRRTSPPSPSLC